MIDSIFIFNGRGNLILSKIYKGNISHWNKEEITLEFQKRVIFEKLEPKPVFDSKLGSYFYINFRHLYIASVTRSNINAALVFEFLYKFLEVLKDFFGIRLDDQVLLDNLIIMNHFLEETVDKGYPQITESEEMKKIVLETEFLPPIVTEESRITIMVSGHINWRKRDIVYRKNEVYIDVVETIEVLLGKYGDILSSKINGTIRLKCYLSGMPECRLVLNDKLLVNRYSYRRLNDRTSYTKFDKTRLHRCIRLSHCDEGIYGFVPPDGEFEFMKYELSDMMNNIPPFRLSGVVIREIGDTKVEIQVTIVSKFHSKKCYGKHVIVKIPVPTNVADYKLRRSNGRIRYDPSENIIEWKFKRFSHDKTERLTGYLDLLRLSTEKKKMGDEKKRTIRICFDGIHHFVASQNKVRSLRVVEHRLGYKASKFCRYSTKSTSYEQKF